MKRFGSLILAVSIFAAGLSGSYPAKADAAVPIKIMLDNYPLSIPGEIVMIKGTTMVPFRPISQALGIEVTWNQAEKTITAVKGEGEQKIDVKLTLNQSEAIVNGSAVKLDVAPISQKGSTLIPLSFFSQQFGAKVGWDQATRTVSLTSPPKKMYTLGFYAISSFSDVEAVPDFSAISYGWSRIDESGKFTTNGKVFQLPPAAGDITPEVLVRNAAEANTTPYLMVYSSDAKGELTKIIEDQSYREQAIADMVKAATDYPFQGIMLDFEGLGLTTDKELTRASFNAFVKELAAATKAADLKLSLALHPLNSSYKGYDYKALGQLADELVIMAYNYEGGSSKRPEPVDKVNEAITLALKETDPSKLILGLNMDNEDENSISTLIGLAKRYNLKGIAIWRLGIISKNEWNTFYDTVEFKS
ncbi:stalk domain-containing protein [Paenibacillus aceti]|uniref:stalk domain-containing protein n=1 Tax=Paenibacillus aceti TaxID=1820010 RepID=UPI000EA2989A